MTAGRPHWSAAYVGLPYVRDTFDCAVLVERVLREVFGRAIELPKERSADVRGLSGIIRRRHADVARPVIHPVEGDAVLMMGRGRLNHIGIYCEIGGEAWVLHAMRAAGQVCLHRIRELERHGLRVEGYYTWK